MKTRQDARISINPFGRERNKWQIMESRLWNMQQNARADNGL